MGKSLDAVKDDIQIGLWIIGFYPVATVALTTAAGAFIGSRTNIVEPGSAAIVGLIAGTGLYIAGRMHVHEYWDRVLDAFEADATREVKDILGYGGDVESYTLRHTSGRTWPGTLDKKFEVTTMVVGDASVAVHEDATLKIPFLENTIGRTTREFYFDQIVSVEYDDPELMIKVSDGELVQYQSTTKPDDVLYDVQDRLRAFKA